MSFHAAKIRISEQRTKGKRVFLCSFEREYLLQRRKIVFFIDTAKLLGKKHLRAGECQGAKKNEEKDTKKRKPLTSVSLFSSLGN